MNFEPFYIERLLIPLRVFPEEEFNVLGGISILLKNAELLDDYQQAILLDLIQRN